MLDCTKRYGQLITEYQSHVRAVSHVVAGSLTVQYGYSNPAGSNYSRLIAVGYPNGRYETYEYDFAIDNAISRIDAISESNFGLVQGYEFLGLSTAVAFDGNNVTLTYRHWGSDTLGSSAVPAGVEAENRPGRNCLGG